ncbi:nucleoside deaminase [Staphylococcus nepalensis]|nr:nucleoside deaminase [Staphylococcus nepalensis]
MIKEGIYLDNERYLHRAIELAEAALNKGNEPFGSLLVDIKGSILFEDFNRISSGDATEHPEIAIAKWAVTHLTPEERKTSIVFTSGEHCPMCATAHALVGLDKIVYVSSSNQLASWLEEMNVSPAPFKNLPIESVIKEANVEGPFEALSSKVKDLHCRYYQQ